MEQEIIRAEGIGKVFQSGERSIRVLRGVSLSLNRGESLAVIGPSGSGKSTLLSILAGLERPSEGRVFFNGADLTAMSESHISGLWGRKIGFVFQSYYLLPSMTAEENVRAPLEIAGIKNSREKALAWLEKVGLAERARHLPSQLSGGEQQRVALARALVSQPEILFADEPTGNLDSKTGREMEELIFSLLGENKTTLVLVTHEMPFARKASRVLELDGGKIV